MKKLIILLAFAISLTMTSCTENIRAKEWGGNLTINLESQERVVNVTWKNADLWILTKIDTTKQQLYNFSEKSTWGIMQGNITIIER